YVVYSLPLHDALPSLDEGAARVEQHVGGAVDRDVPVDRVGALREARQAAGGGAAAVAPSGAVAGGEPAAGQPDLAEAGGQRQARSEEHTSELQSRENL